MLLSTAICQRGSVTRLLLLSHAAWWRHSPDLICWFSVLLPERLAGWMRLRWLLANAVHHETNSAIHVVVLNVIALNVIVLHVNVAIHVNIGGHVWFFIGCVL